MALYEVCILFLFLMDKYLLNEFIIRSFGITYMFTKICAILLIFVELVSIKENVEETFNISLWDILKKAFLRAKEVRKNIDEIS